MSFANATDPHIDAVLSALSDPMRRTIIDRIRTSGPISPTELAEDLPVSRQAVSKHLLVLANAGLVDSAPAGRGTRYQIRPGALDSAAAWMSRQAAQWKTTLNAVKSAAEANHRTEG